MKKPVYFALAAFAALLVMLCSPAPPGPREDEAEATEHAISLLQATHRDAGNFDVSMQWMNQAWRVERLGKSCRQILVQSANNDAYEACLEKFRAMPDFWQATFVERSQNYPVTVCTFNFDEDFEEIATEPEGCDTGT